jgi:uncharacterized protein YecE (DUF72 family)
MGAVVGTSGWQYDDWRGVLYPKELPKAKWLEHFSAHFPACEVNNTFYNLPKEQVFASWATRTPEAFTFALKASRFITHVRRLDDVAEAVTRLVERASLLGEKLGPVLYQLPPSLGRDDRLLASFLEILPEHPRSAIEFRNASWFDEEVFAAMGKRDVALCIADGEKPSPIRATASWAYLRLHGGPGYTQYPPEENAAWAERIAGIAAETDPVYVFFNNDVAGAAVLDARAITGRLAALGVPVAEPPAGAIL